jgi:hypothetical protein
VIAVGFSDGSEQWLGRLIWRQLVERTRDKLREQGKPSLEYEIPSYGVSFALMTEEVRIPVASAFYKAVLEVQQEKALEENWDTGAYGPYFGNLVHLIEHELDIDRQESRDRP